MGMKSLTVSRSEFETIMGDWFDFDAFYGVDEPITTIITVKEDGDIEWETEDKFVTFNDPTAWDILSGKFPDRITGG